MRTILQAQNKILLPAGAGASALASPPTAPRNNVGWATATTTLIDRHRRPNVDQSERVQQQVEDSATLCFLGQQAAGRLQGGCRTEESHQQRVLFVHSVAKLPQCLQCLRLRAVEAAWHGRLQPLPDLRQLLLHRHTIHYPPLPLLRQQTDIAVVTDKGRLRQYFTAHSRSTSKRDSQERTTCVTATQHRQRSSALHRRQTAQ